MPSNFIKFVNIILMTISIAKTIIYIANFLKYLFTDVLNSYLCTKYGSIHEYDTNWAIDVAAKIPVTPNHLQNTIDNIILVTAAIYGVVLAF